MHPQLRAIANEFESARDRLHRLLAALPEHLFDQRPEPTRWSVADCVAHLNLTATAYLPLLDAGLAQGRVLNGPAPRHYRRDPVGWLVWRMIGPPVRIRTKTAARFVPTDTSNPSELVPEFERLQQEQIRRVEQADGLPLGRVTITSAFDARAKYNLFACLSILPRHQHRHLWQAERVADQISRAAAHGRGV